jgi:hypothetical protein
MAKSKTSSKSRGARVKALPWAALAQVAVAAGRRWKGLSGRERARLAQLTRESKGRLNNLSARERSELRKLAGKLDLKGMGRELLPLVRGGRAGRKARRRSR